MILKSVRVVEAAERPLRRLFLLCPHFGPCCLTWQEVMPHQGEQAGLAVKKSVKERQRDYLERAKAQGFHRIHILVPADRVDEIKEIAHQMRDNFLKEKTKKPIGE